MSPHEGELRRFIPAAFEQTTCRVTLATLAAAKANCVVLFKGVETRSSPHQRVNSPPFLRGPFNTRAGSRPPGPATSCPGFITGLLARGLGAFEAASVAAQLHLHFAQRRLVRVL